MHLIRVTSGESHLYVGKVLLKKRAGFAVKAKPWAQEWESAEEAEIVAEALRGKNRQFDVTFTVEPK